MKLTLPLQNLKAALRFTASAVVFIVLLTGELAARSPTLHFAIPKEDQQTYRVRSTEGGRLLSINLSNPRVLFPAAAVEATLPNHVAVEAGKPVYPAITIRDRKVCSGLLADMDFSQQSVEAVRPLRFRTLFEHAQNERELFEYFASPDKRWIASCLRNNGPCTNVFLNAGWDAEFVVHREDLCRATAMNAKLVSIVEPWKRSN